MSKCDIGTDVMYTNLEVDCETATRARGVWSMSCGLVIESEDQEMISLFLLHKTHSGASDEHAERSWITV